VNNLYICVIIADFEVDNKKCNENYRGQMCYMVHWIDTDEIWDPFIYHRENATEEFVWQIDKELK
jgi:hypothetical protein